MSAWQQLAELLACSCSYIKENGILRLGVSVAYRNLHTGVVNGLRCQVEQSKQELPFDSPGLLPFGMTRTTLRLTWRINMPWNGQNMKRQRSLGTLPLLWISAISSLQMLATVCSSVTGHHFPARQEALRSLGTGDLASKPTVVVINKDNVEVIIGNMHYSPPQVLCCSSAEEVVENQNRTSHVSMDNSASSLITLLWQCRRTSGSLCWLPCKCNPDEGTSIVAFENRGLSGLMMWTMTMKVRTTTISTMRRMSEGWNYFQQAANMLS